MSGQIWSVADEGGYLWAPNLSEYLRMQNLPVVKFRQLCDVKENDADGKPLVGKGRGDKWYWNVFTKLSTKGRAIDETERMPSGSFKVTQYSGTMTEFGNSVDYTGKLDDLSEQPIKEIIRKVLKIDVAEAFDVAAWQQFDQTLLGVTPVSGTSTTAVNTFTTDGTANSVTNNTRKFVRTGMPHYTNAEEEVMMFTGDANSAYNEFAFGGGSSIYNAATVLRFYTAATTTTLTGTERMTIDSSGNVGINETVPTSKLHVAGPISTAISTKTTTYTITATDSTILADANTAGFTITLPTAVGATGRIYVIKKIDSTGNVVTIDANGSETIDGSLTQSLDAQWESITIQSNGANWFII